ncbi:MAG: dipeptide ABC transporter ATP-binding protein [Firmicutes bacterium]|jgi:oligopeptide transport system ATP-binding protein|nr:dipeptide ABC transporter ATP-binding protein [Bacillota bacterium]
MTKNKNERTGAPLLELEEVKKYFYKDSIAKGKRQCIKAVDGISLEIEEGETVGLVGESGCGKSTLGRAILNLNPATEGIIRYQGDEIQKLNFRQMRPYRKEMQMIFQDPYASLNPRRTIMQSMVEPLEMFSIGAKAEQKERAIELLNEVGISRSHLDKFPHELSGGQRQRIAIARSIILNPKFIVADEPVSALDVSVRSQVLNLMQRFQREYNLSYLFISHDLSVVRFLCDRVVVMYLGKMVECADKAELYAHPTHPYSQALLSAIPVPDVHKKTERIVLQGDLPSPANPPSGCVFHTRCRYATEECSRECPALRTINGTHQVACHHGEKLYG